jgi:hypothetical protein
VSECECIYMLVGQVNKESISISIYGDRDRERDREIESNITCVEYICVSLTKFRTSREAPCLTKK